MNDIDNAQESVFRQQTPLPKDICEGMPTKNIYEGLKANNIEMEKTLSQRVSDLEYKHRRLKELCGCVINTISVNSMRGYMTCCNIDAERNLQILLAGWQEELRKY